MLYIRNVQFFHEAKLPATVGNLVGAALRADERQ